MFSSRANRSTPVILERPHVQTAGDRSVDGHTRPLSTYYVGFVDGLTYEGPGSHPCGDRAFFW